MARYSYNGLRQIQFTEVDIRNAQNELKGDDLLKTVVSVYGLNEFSAKTTKALGELAATLDGTVTTRYGALSITQPRNAEELREQALQNLRHSEKWESLRDRRAEESGVWKTEGD